MTVQELLALPRYAYRFRVADPRGEVVVQSAFGFTDPKAAALVGQLRGRALAEHMKVPFEQGVTVEVLPLEPAPPRPTCPLCGLRLTVVLPEGVAKCVCCDIQDFNGPPCIHRQPKGG